MNENCVPGKVHALKQMINDIFDLTVWFEFAYGHMAGTYKNYIMPINKSICVKNDPEMKYNPHCHKRI